MGITAMRNTAIIMDGYHPFQFIICIGFQKETSTIIIQIMAATLPYLLHLQIRGIFLKAELQNEAQHS